LVIEMPSSDLATIEALRPLTLFGREYRSVQSAEPLHLLLVDLDRRLTRGTP
jgi:hypothetical protein